MSKPLLLILFCSLFLFGCAASPDANDFPLSLDKPFNLSLGETARLDSGDLSIAFLDVPADSRCPDGAVCIRAGDVQVNLTVMQDGMTTDLALVSDGIADDNRRSYASIGEYTVTLLEVMPLPKMGEEKEGRAYKARLVVRKD